MRLFIDFDGERREALAPKGASVLDVLQAEGVAIRATCGGAGTCGRCQVLVRTDEGVGHALACTTPACEGMEVVVERAGALDVVERGMSRSFPPDAGAQGFGMAVDIGTTTVVAHLHDLSSGARLATVGRPNPQIAFGSDVISRISASVEGKLGLMTAAIRDALREMRARLSAEAGVDEGRIMRTSIAGNTVMQHIAAGLAPDTIGMSPFAPLSLFGDVREVEGLGRCRFARCVAGYVGGDVTAGMLACGLDEGGTRLFIDLGTNGEMALAVGGRIACCATAAGPVFEGANIRFGMPASPGAISGVAWEGGRLRTRVVGGVRPVGLCGTGLIDAIALLVREGIVDETGRLLDADEASGPLSARVARVDGCLVFKLVEDGSVYLTQDDVRKVQLAKAAVCAGVLTLMDATGTLLSDIDSLEVAGGFGAYLNGESAAAIGLFPPGLLRCAKSVGNTSGEGAAALLLSARAREREAEIAGKCDYLELSTSAKFNEFYIEQMEFEGAVA